MDTRTTEERREQKREWYQRNRDKILAHYATQSEKRNETSRVWDQNHPERKQERLRKFRASEAGKDKAKHDSFLRRFREHGLTLDEYHALVERQNFLCAVCLEEPQVTYGGSHDGFHIDHDHKTERVRGLLCDKCNVAIGMLRDSPEFARSAASYLERTILLS